MKLYQWSRDYFKTKLGEAVPTDVTDVTQPCKSGLDETCVSESGTERLEAHDGPRWPETENLSKMNLEW